MNKRGLIQIDVLIYMILALVVFISVLYYFMHSSSLFGTKYNGLELQAKTQACQSRGALNPSVFDNDFGVGKGDGFPDGCDVCLGGNDAVDENGDGMPDACEAEKYKVNAPPTGTHMEDLCKGTWDKKLSHCVLDCYQKKSCLPA